MMINVQSFYDMIVKNSLLVPLLLYYPPLLCKIRIHVCLKFHKQEWIQGSPKNSQKISLVFSFN